MRRSPRRQHLNSACFSTLPDETIVEILSYVEVHELLCVAWTCRRWHRAALDSHLWRRTRFEACDAGLLLPHFRKVGRSEQDHTGTWTRCARALDGKTFVCRSVELDYVDKGEGVCYRLLRSVSCLQQLHHPHIVPLQLINLDPPRNRVRYTPGAL